MHLQILTFDGPRSPELVEAAARGGRERIQPIIAADPELNTRLLGGFRAVAPDGSECVVTLARDAEAFALLHQRVMASELLPGEDPALLPGPTRVVTHAVQGVLGPMAGLLAELEP